MERRLRKDEKTEIIKKLKDRGYEVSTKSRDIHIWQAGLYIGNFTWEKNIGWRLLLICPTIYTPQDLEPVIDEIGYHLDMKQKIKTAWDKYKTSPSQKNWQNYQGLLASFYIRQMTGALNGLITKSA